MALNVALPLSGLSEMFEGCCLLSPISPIEVTFRETYKMMASPDSESSSGVSSFDSDDRIKKYHTAPHLRSSSPTITESDQSSTSSTPSEPSTPDEVAANTKSSVDPEKQFAALIAKRQLEEAIYRHENRPIMLGGRNILDLAANLNNSYLLQYAELPENNLKMYMANRSQYHRLSAAGHQQEYNTAACRCCQFTFPLVETGPIPASAASSTSASLAQSMLSTMVMTPPPPTKRSPVPMTNNNNNNNNSVNMQQQQQQQQLEILSRLYKLGINNGNNGNMSNLSNIGTIGNMNGNNGNNSGNNNNNSIFNNVGNFNSSQNTNSNNNNNGFMNQMNGPKPIRGANHMMNNSHNNNNNNGSSNTNNGNQSSTTHNAAFLKFLRSSNGMGNNNNNNYSYNHNNGNIGGVNNHIMNQQSNNSNGGNHTPFKMYKHF